MIRREYKQHPLRDQINFCVWLHATCLGLVPNHSKRPNLCSDGSIASQSSLFKQNLFLQHQATKSFVFCRMEEKKKTLNCKVRKLEAAKTIYHRIKAGSDQNTEHCKQKSAESCIRVWTQNQRPQPKEQHGSSLGLCYY